MWEVESLGLSYPDCLVHGRGKRRVVLFDYWPRLRTVPESLSPGSVLLAAAHLLASLATSLAWSVDGVQ